MRISKRFSKIGVIGVVVLLLLGGYWFYTSIRVCGFAITAARNSFTNVCKEFPSTCLPLWYRNDITCQNELGWKSPGDLVSSGDTSNWKTYRNEQYGFEVKLPPDWSVESATGADKLYFLSADTKRALDEDKKNCATATQYNCIAEMPLSDIAFYQDSLVAKIAPDTIETRVINGVIFQVFPYNATMFPTMNYEATYNGDIYHFRIGIGDKLGLGEQILSTFKFVEQQ